MRKIFFLLLFFSPILLGQNNEKYPDAVIGIHGGVGYEFAVLNGMNDFLLVHDFFEIANRPTEYIYLGVTARNSPVSPFIAQSYLYINLKEKLNNNSSLNSCGLVLNCLYDLNKKERWTIAPLVGFSMNHANLILVSKNINSSVSNGKIEEYYERTNYGVRFGFSFERNISIRRSNHIAIGLTSYYKLDLGNKNWYNTNNHKLMDAPKSAYSNFGFQAGVSFLF